MANKAQQTRAAIRFRGRSFLATVLAPELPLDEWLAELDKLAGRSQGYFASRPVILDVTGLAITKRDFTDLIETLFKREIKVMGVEGADPSWLGFGMPPSVSGGKQTEILHKPSAEPPKQQGFVERTIPSLLIEQPVRSGQSIIFPQGDVTVLGSVASGAEIIAGNSVHIYGTLRGRAIAGSTGNAAARIFCQKFEAELIAIDGLYQTADEIDPSFRGRAVQAWLANDKMNMAALA
ncbi:septum site-determining protein MinC [Kaistia dalseonensis]|uniref:Probable septum site-determining protein MinC n=1 Tax=Kaistia dalseonensis TaxID=410840 RepID=A0ABU0H622_9HYPH|nr:septum site-determining protein MinC [Kaistia dalseonensis]MCX5495163.1 septum site-determining protein MinC [Kaistia dalseonensis]MDQ0437746.1 septum site-determining protein MinC [Kaistia dalseonensis]